MNKIALGTAQFGLDYGINNKLGKIPKKAVFEILAYATARGVDMLDTASVYGDSESVLGEYIRRNAVNFKIVSKLPSGAKNGKIFEDSLKRLSVDSLYGYLVHDLKSFLQQPIIWTDLVRFRENDLVRKIGFSIYYPKDMDILRDLGIRPDLVQVPYSLFDQRFATVFPAMKAQGIEIHIRSVFLQGLVFKRPEEFDGCFLTIKPKAVALHTLAKRTGVSISALCVNFALLNPLIDRVVIGVDSLNNIKENLDGLECSSTISAVYRELECLRVEDENIILPFLWNKV